jgi:hypothetical protein
MLLLEGAILRQVTAGLTHKPDGRPVNRALLCGGKETLARGHLERS